MYPPRRDREFVHFVGEDDTILFVSPEWLAFAEENQTPHLDADSVIGQSLYRYIHGKETTHLYQMMTERVRRTQRTITIPFRCDSPTVRRYMEMTISPMANSQVQFTGRILREEYREAIPLLAPESDRSNDFVVVCSWCKLVKTAEEWLEVEIAVKRLNLFNTLQLPKISHGMCEACARRVKLRIAESN